MKSYAIVVVCYKRLFGVKRLVESLEKANFMGRTDIDLIFSVDCGNNNELIDFINKYEWKYGNKIVRTFAEKQGLKKHILECGDYTNSYDIVCVLEDDVYVSPCFFCYSYQAASYYWNDSNIAGISLYAFQKNWLFWDLRFEPAIDKYDVFFMKIAQSWGQVWTKKQWDSFKKWLKDNHVFKPTKDIPQNLFNWPESSWLKYFDRYLIEKNKFFVYPYVSLSTNFSETGEHAKQTCCDYQSELQQGKTEFCFVDFSYDAILYDEYMNRMGIEKFLSLDNNNVKMDLFGTKNIDCEKEYVVTAVKYKNVRPIKTFSLSLHPIEQNIIDSMFGDGIYVYKTESIKNKKRNVNRLYNYYLRISDYRFLVRHSFFSFFVNIREKLFRNR